MQALAWPCICSKNSLFLLGLSRTCSRSLPFNPHLHWMAQNVPISHLSQSIIFVLFGLTDLNFPDSPTRCDADLPGRRSFIIVYRRTSLRGNENQLEMDRCTKCLSLHQIWPPFPVCPWKERVFYIANVHVTVPIWCHKLIKFSYFMIHICKFLPWKRVAVLLGSWKRRLMAGLAKGRGPVRLGFSTDDRWLFALEINSFLVVNQPNLELDLNQPGIVGSRF